MIVIPTLMGWSYYTYYLAAPVSLLIEFNYM